MRWFKHFSDAAHDEVLSELIDEFGAEGYGAFWLIIEAITTQIQDDPRDYVRYSEKKWRKITDISTKKFRKLLSFLQESGKLLVKNSVKNNNNYLEIKVPKILQIADEYTKKRIKQEDQTPDKLWSLSGVTPEKISPRLDKNGLDKKNIYMVFNYWKSILNHPKAKLTKDRETKIRARLKEKYSVDDLKKTIDSCKASSYHMGDNEQNKVYDSIELLFRNGDKVEQFWGY